MAGYSTERDNEDRAKRSSQLTIFKGKLLFAKKRYKSAISNILFCVHELMLIVFSDWFIFCWRWSGGRLSQISFYCLTTEIVKYYCSDFKLKHPQLEARVAIITIFNPVSNYRKDYKPLSHSAVSEKLKKMFPLSRKKHHMEKESMRNTL